MVAHKFAGHEFAGFGDSVERPERPDRSRGFAKRHALRHMAGNLVRTTPRKGSSRLKRGTPAWDDE
jgi:hypothetical protein